MCGNNCCCCISVKAGTLINLWITVIFWGIPELHVIRAILINWSTSSPEDTSNLKQKVLESTSALYRNDSSSEIIPTMFDSWSATAFLSAAFCTYGVILAIAISGLFAVVKKKPSLLIPYFVYRAFWTFLMSLLLVSLVFAEGYLIKLLGRVNITWCLDEILKIIAKFAEEVIMWAILIVILILILEVHFTIVVYRYYRQMEKEEEKERNAAPMSATWSAANETSVQISEKGLSCQPQC